MKAKNPIEAPIRFLRNPTTIKQLSEQIRLACDDYLSRKLSEKDFKELLFHFAH